LDLQFFGAIPGSPSLFDSSLEKYKDYPQFQVASETNLAPKPIFCVSGKGSIYLQALIPLSLYFILRIPTVHFQFKNKNNGTTSPLISGMKNAHNPCLEGIIELSVSMEKFI
jgi:hypothetical protein